MLTGNIAWTALVVVLAKIAHKIRSVHKARFRIGIVPALAVFHSVCQVDQRD
jgi:hypothetical protein